MKQTVSPQSDMACEDRSEFSENLPNNDVQSILSAKEAALRILDKRVTELRKAVHSSEDTQNLMDHTINFDRDLTDILDLLNDRLKSISVEDINTLEFTRALHLECQNLIARNEKISRKLADDMMICFNTKQPMN